MSFPNNSHFDRTSHVADERIRQGIEQRAKKASESDTLKRHSRVAVALLDVRAEIEERLEGEGDDRVRDILQDFDNKITDLLDLLN